MKDDLFRKAQFVKTAVHAKDYPVLRNKHGQFMDEIAVVGRSNVGKSSLLNFIFHSKDLVKTSSVPGKTQAINFFNVNDVFCFVDLPGYGYAQVPQSVRKKWGPMIQEYLANRESLKLILFLFDIRRIPNEEDLELLEWIAYHEKSLILVLTKADKLNQSERVSFTKRIMDSFPVGNLHWTSFSTKKNIGHVELPRMILDAIRSENE